MKITKEQEEKLILLIQGAVCMLFLGAALHRDAKDQRKVRKKVLAHNARREDKLAKEEYKWKQKLLKQQYKRKYENTARTARRERKKGLPRKLSYDTIS